jgi:hypothetical protein
VANPPRAGLIENFPFPLTEAEAARHIFRSPQAASCVSAWKKDPVGGVIGVQKGPLW